MQVRVTNTGDRAGSDVVQVYVRDLESTVYRPDQELKGFAKVHLEPGASEVVAIVLDRRSFAVWDVAAHDWLVEAGRFEVVVARSSTDPVEALEVEVGSGDQVGAAVGPSGFVATDAEFADDAGPTDPDAGGDPAVHPQLHPRGPRGHPGGPAAVELVVREGLKRSAAEFPDPDDATMAMVRAMLREGPARMLVMMGDGVISFPQLDALLDALDGRWGRLGGSVVRQLRRLGRRRPPT